MAPFKLIVGVNENPHFPLDPPFTLQTAQFSRSQLSY